MSPLKRNTSPYPLGTVHLPCLQNQLYALGIAPTPYADEHVYKCFKAPLTGREEIGARRSRRAANRVLIRKSSIKITKVNQKGPTPQTPIPKTPDRVGSYDDAGDGDGGDKNDETDSLRSKEIADADDDDDSSTESSHDATKTCARPNSKLCNPSPESSNGQLRCDQQRSQMLTTTTTPPLSRPMMRPRHLLVRTANSTILHQNHPTASSAAINRDRKC
ncbi:MAG: hypothetical protein Q9193_005640 [Seirophora villosa]